MRWRSLGRFLTPPVAAGWGISHAAVPTVEGIRDDTVSVLFAARDELGRSSIGRVRLRLADGSTVVEREPVLTPGRRGTFDDSGVTPSCVVDRGDDRLLYYTGWSLGTSVPFYLFAGCAVSEDGGRSYRRLSEAPIMPRANVDPLLTASPWVLRVGGRWHMWYVSATHWDLVDERPKHWYHVRYAESRDGVEWDRQGLVALNYAAPDEHAFSRPSVLYDGERFHMWFSVRGDAYRLAYAVSEDGRAWLRDDAVALEGIREWDSEMQAYPAVFDHGGTRWMLYNGNGYGATGIGYATQSTSDLD